MPSRPLFFALLVSLVSENSLLQAADLAPFSVPASDSAAVHRTYGITAFANPASNALVSVDAGILRAEFDLASDSTEGYSANVGLSIPLSSEGGPVRLAIQEGRPLLIRVRYEYRLSEKVTDILGSSFESGVGSASSYYMAQNLGAAALVGSPDWKTASFSYDDFIPPIRWFDVPEPFPTFDSVLAHATAFRVEPKSYYSDSGFKDGSSCTRCVNPTMKHQVLELRNIRIDRLGPAGDTTALVLGLPKAQVGVARRRTAPASDIFWQGGILRISQPSRWTSVSVLAPDGRHLRTLASSAAQPLDLLPGTYRLLLAGRDGHFVSKAVVGLR